MTRFLVAIVICESKGQLAVVNNFSSVIIIKHNFTLWELVHLQLRLLQSTYCWKNWLRWISKGTVATFWKWSRQIYIVWC